MKNYTGKTKDSGVKHATWRWHRGGWVTWEAGSWRWHGVAEQMAVAGTPRVCSFCWKCVVPQKNEHVGATKSKVWIGNCHVKVWKSTEHQLQKIWCSVKFEWNEHTPVSQKCVYFLQDANRATQIWGLFILKTFNGFVYSKSQAVHVVNLEWTKPLKIFKRVKGLSACVFNELIVLELRSRTN